MSNILLDLFFFNPFVVDQTAVFILIVSLITKLGLYKRIFFADINYGIRDTNAVTKRVCVCEGVFVCVCVYECVHPSSRINLCMKQKYHFPI